jgi:hypothetical protein
MILAIITGCRIELSLISLNLLSSVEDFVHKSILSCNRGLGVLQVRVKLHSGIRGG